MLALLAELVATPKTSARKFSAKPWRIAVEPARLEVNQLVGVDGGVDRLMIETLPARQSPGGARLDKSGG